MNEKNLPDILDVRQIMERLPHRYPFLLVDRIIEVEDDKRVVAIKNVTINEPFFQGHFPGEPIMPGVLQVEAMAQVGAVMVLGKPENKGKILFLAGVDKARFRKPVVPGDRLRIEVELIRMRSGVGEASGRVLVDGAVAAEAIIKFAVSR